MFLLNNKFVIELLRQIIINYHRLHVNILRYTIKYQYISPLL
jgi:hypothetical protein